MNFLEKLKHPRERALDERDLLLDRLDGLVDVALLHVIHVLHLQAHQLVRYLCQKDYTTEGMKFCFLQRCGTGTVGTATF
jgi:hypothetical protein